MTRALWDWGSGRIGPHETGARGYSGAFSQRAFAEMTMADAAVKAVGFIKRTLPNGICPTGAARAGWQDLHDKTIERDKIRPVEPSFMAGFAR